MIKHIYLYKINEKSKLPEIKEKLMTMKEAFSYMVDMEIGIDFKGASNSMELSEICVFKDMEDFKKFGAEPYHEEIRQYMKQFSNEGYKIDYEI